MSDSLKSKVVSGVFWLTATKAIGQAITWLITIAVVRLLSPADYGLMGIATLFIGLLLLFNELGLGAAVVQKADLNTDHLSDLRWAILLINVALCLLLVLGAPMVARYFNEPSLTSIIRALAVIFVIQGVGSPSACMLQRGMQFKTKSRAELIGNVTGSMTTLAFAFAGFRVWSLVAGYLALQLTTHGLYCFHHPIPFRRRFSPSNVRPFLNFGFHMTSSRVLWYISSNADSVVVGRMLGAVQLGYYGLAFQLSTMPTDKIMSIVTQVAYPSFCALQNDDATLKRYFLKLISVVSLITFPMFLGFFIIAERGIPLLLTSRWAPVIVPLQILCSVSCLRAIGSLNTPMLMAKGRTRLILFNFTLQAILLPLGFYIGARYGLVGVSVAWLVLGPLLFGVMTAQTLQVVGLTVGDYAAALRHAAFGSVVMVGFVTLVQRALLEHMPASYHVALTVVMGVALYGAYQAVMNRGAFVEMRSVLKRPAAARVERQAAEASVA